MSADYFDLGNWNAICDQCGQKRKASQIRTRWDNAKVCGECWEPRHPQDFVRGKENNQSVPWARPDGLVFIEDNGQPVTIVTPQDFNGEIGNTVRLGRVDPATLVPSL